jgi:hypothetical protein
MIKGLFVYSLCIWLSATLTGKHPVYEGNQRPLKDTMVPFAKKFVSYVDNVGSKGQWNRKVYVKRVNHDKLRAVPNPDAWPDSIEKTINVIYLKGQPVAYVEIPLTQAGDTYLEYDWYFYKGKLVATKVIYTDYKSACLKNPGLLNEKTFIVYDSIANPFSKEFTAEDITNKPIDLKKCGQVPMDQITLYKTFSETPFNKYGIEKK